MREQTYDRTQSLLGSYLFQSQGKVDSEKSVPQSSDLKLAAFCEEYAAVRREYAAAEMDLFSEGHSGARHLRLLKAEFAKKRAEEKRQAILSHMSLVASGYQFDRDGVAIAHSKGRAPQVPGNFDKALDNIFAS